MLFAVLVVERDVLLQAVGDVLVADDDLSVGSVAEDVEDVEQLARVAPAEAEQRFCLDYLDPPFAQGRVGCDRPFEQQLQVGLLHRFEHIDLATRKQRRDHLERRVFRRRADQRDDTLFDGAEQRILLRFVEPVDLVDEQERRRGIEKLALARLFDHFAHLFDARGDGRQGKEFALERRGDEFGKRGFAYARRSPEDERGNVAGLDEFAEYALRTHQVLLPDVFVQGAGA